MQKSKASLPGSGSRYEHIKRADVERLFPQVKIVIDDEGNTDTVPDYSEIGIHYAREVVAGREPACGTIKMACRRFLTMIDMAKDQDCPWIYSPLHVIDYVRFFERLPFVEDNWKGAESAPAELFQCFIACNIYGFRNRRNEARWIKEAYLELPRKHAKSHLASTVGLYDLISGRLSPQIIIGAPIDKQANKVFGPMSMQIERNQDLAEIYGLSAIQKIIRCSHNGGTVEKISHKPEHQDGFNPYLVILEELHAQKQGIFEVMDSAMGARAGQMILMITTAGRIATGGGWEARKRAMGALTGKTTDWQTFAYICTPEPDEIEDTERLFKDEKIMIRCNPMWGVSLDPDDIRRKAQVAKDFPAQRAEFLRTRLNIWGLAGGALLSPERWDACGRDITIADMLGRKCWIGVDLSIRNDMTAIGLLFEYEDKLAGFAQYWLPEDSPTLRDPNIASLASSWIDEGYLTVIPGARMRYDPLFKELEAYIEVFDVQTIAFDPAMSQELSHQVFEAGMPAVVYPNNKYTMTLPTDDLMARVAGEEFVHPKNPILTWNALNVTGERRVDDTIIPKKESADSWRKIDGFAALVFANGVRLNAHQIKPDEREQAKELAYAERGLRDI